MSRGVLRQINAEQAVLLDASGGSRIKARFVQRCIRIIEGYLPRHRAGVRRNQRVGESAPVATTTSDDVTLLWATRDQLNVFSDNDRDYAEQSALLYASCL